ncbi:syntaxin-1A isoform X1 [Tachysurus ichikawai]
MGNFDILKEFYVPELTFFISNGMVKGKDTEEEEEVAVGMEKGFMDEFFEQGNESEATISIQNRVYSEAENHQWAEFLIQTI